MHASNTIRLITGAWADNLAQFTRQTEFELLLVSPWLTTGATALIASSLSIQHEIALKIIARLDTADFDSGASQIESFSQFAYPSSTHLEIRALALLHAKILISDRKRVLVGSANLTEGGLFRNHEAMVYCTKPDFATDIISFFFELWTHATPVGLTYLDQIRLHLQEVADERHIEENVQRPKVYSRPKPRASLKSISKYVRPQRYNESRYAVTEALSIPLTDSTEPPEEVQSALNWLEKELRHIQRSNRENEKTIRRLERLMFHPQMAIRATAIDRAGRIGVPTFASRLLAILSNPIESPEVRSAAAFSLGLIGMPATFSSLLSTSQEDSDAGRWSRRACFAMLRIADPELRSEFFAQIPEIDQNLTLQLADEAIPEKGTISERLTKALLIEMQAMKRWRHDEINFLSYIMALSARRITFSSKSHSRFVQLPVVVRNTATILNVAKGDLSHGPFSVSLLRRLMVPGEADPWVEQHLAGLNWSDEKLRTYHPLPSVSSDQLFQEILKVADPFYKKNTD